MIKNYIENIYIKGGEGMNEMETNRSEYVAGGYKDYRGNYRNDYRDNYRDDYRDSYRNNYRGDYDMRGGRMNRRNNRNYREEEIYQEIEDAMFDAKECHRKFEDLSEMTEDPKIKNTLMKIAMREKEHYDSLKELLEK